MTQRWNDPFSKTFTYVEKRKLFIGKENPAQLGRSDAKISSYMMFFQSLYQVGVSFKKFLITGFGRVITK
jgi:hypothetical protein